ncbi:MAG: hypothetical protein IT433_01670 [Phycisphaerales bacterium]|nr:hypothetical protein [Phycisphaerales bacterium]
MHQETGGTGGRGRGEGTALAWAFVLLYALGLAVSVTLFVKGMREVGAIGLLLVLTGAPLALGLMKVAAGRREESLRLEGIEASVRHLAEQSVLSDDARRVLNRDSERTLLMGAIEQDIAGQNWDAAMVLIEELAGRFGYRADAEAMRQRVEEARRKTREMEITEAIGFLDGLILQRRWDDALAEAGRVQRLFPGSPRVEPLRDRVAAARAAYRDDLERRFMDAAGADQSNEAMVLLKELDQYLTPEQAESMKTMARGVIGRAREELGARFKGAVQERQWSDAVGVGEQIMRQFPNTRMAAEVREMMEQIRTKANSPA